MATVKPHNGTRRWRDQVLKANHLLSATWISSPDQQQWNYENTPLFQRFDFQYPNTQKAVSSDCCKFRNGIGFPLKYSLDILLNHWGCYKLHGILSHYILLPPSGDHRALTDAHNHQDTTEHDQASCLEWLSRNCPKLAVLPSSPTQGITRKQVWQLQTETLWKDNGQLLNRFRFKKPLF